MVAMPTGYKIVISCTLGMHGINLIRPDRILHKKLSNNFFNAYYAMNAEFATLNLLTIKISYMVIYKMPSTVPVVEK